MAEKTFEARRSSACLPRHHQPDPSIFQFQRERDRDDAQLGSGLRVPGRTISSFMDHEWDRCRSTAPLPYAFFTTW